MAQRIFYAAKINIHGNILSPDLTELIEVHIPRVILEQKPDLKIHTWNWTFTDVKQIEIDERKLITGNVTKSKYVTQKVRIGYTTAQVKSDNEIAHTAFFIYDPDGEILIHESTGSVSAEEFRNLFNKLLSSDPLVGEVVINPIPVPMEIRKELSSIENVTAIKFSLIHPNPGRDEFNLYQNLIKENNVKELELSMANKDGLAVTGTDDELIFTGTIEDGIDLVESGYGSVVIRGFDKITIEGKKRKRTEKRKRRFSSKKSVRLLKVNEHDQERLISKLFKFILSVKDKTKEDGDEDERKE